MKLRIRRLWTKALESGKYKQATGALKTKTGYCCLGVLCDLHRKETAPRKKGMWEPYRFGLSRNFTYLNNASTLPEEVMKWAGLESDDPMVEAIVEGVRCDHELSSMNDCGITFKDIAKAIRKSL